ncbi:MAG: class I SAM-dependent methyltransferase [Sneathiellaceae bacterium]
MSSGNADTGSGNRPAGGSIWSDEPVWTPLSPEEAAPAAGEPPMPEALRLQPLQPQSMQPQRLQPQPPPQPAPAVPPAVQPAAMPSAPPPVAPDAGAAVPLAGFEQLTRPPEPAPAAPPAMQVAAMPAPAPAPAAPVAPDPGAAAPLVTFEQLTRPPEPAPHAPPASSGLSPMAIPAAPQPAAPQPAAPQPAAPQPAAPSRPAAPDWARLPPRAAGAAPPPPPQEPPAPVPPAAQPAPAQSGVGAISAAVEPGLTVLHVGCGPHNPAALPAALRTSHWREVRLDANPDMNPDIVASITDMRQVPDASMDAVYSSHNLEHIYPHEAPAALREFVRVMKPDGLCLLLCPDLQTIGDLIAEGRLLEPIYHSAAGPISAIDMLYGHRASMAGGNIYMAHRNGFSAPSLAQLMQEAGFRKVAVTRDTARFSLWALGFRVELSDELVARCQANLGIGRPLLPAPGRS